MRYWPNVPSSTTPPSKNGGTPTRAPGSASTSSTRTRNSPLYGHRTPFGPASVPSWVVGVLRRAENARQAFYRRVKAGEKPGFPRFKSRRRWRTIHLAGAYSGMVKPGYFSIKGMPKIKFKDKGRLPSAEHIRSIAITRRGRRLAWCRKGSRDWRRRVRILGNAYSKERFRNRNDCHQITTGIVRRIDVIAVEDLQVKNMTRTAGGRSRSRGQT